MVRAYYISGPNENQELTTDEVETLSGALYCKLKFNKMDGQVILEDIKKQTGYNFDQVFHFSPRALPENEYRDTIREFHKEHMHLEHEIRIVIEGTTSFDLRDFNDEWIQIILFPGDMLILPAGVYHRLSLVEENPEVKVVRLFKHRHTWRTFHRPEIEQDINFRTR